MHFGFSKEALEHYFFSQPHQLFFVAAFINAFVSMSIFALSYGGAVHIAVSPVAFHAYALLFLVFTPAFTGFLFTTFPRFNATEAVSKDRYVAVFSLLYIGSVLYLLGGIVASFLAFIGAVSLFIAHATVFKTLLDIYKRANVPDTHDSFWILSSMGVGVAAHALFIVSQFYEPLYLAAKETGVYGYLFMVALSVAQRMIPFFSHSMEGRNDTFLRHVFALIVLHIGLQILYSGAAFLPDALLAYVTFREIRRWRLPFPNPNALLWVLHIAVFWIPVAFLFAVMENLLILLHGPSLMGLGIHTLMLGFLFTVLIGFGTRVTIGHSGNVMQATQWEVWIFNATQLVVVLRLLLSVAAGFDLDVTPLFHTTVSAWLVLIGIWAWRFFPLLVYGKKLDDEKK